MIMHSFVVVAAKPERRIPQDALNFLNQADTADLSFAPDDHMFWSDEARRVAFSGWQRLTDVGQVGSYWHRSERGLTAFAGRMWPKGGMWKSDSSWAEQLESFWRTHPVADSGQPLDGVYTGVSIAGTGAGRMVTDPLSIAMIYRAETDDFVAYSTSPRLSARVAAGPAQEPERDPLGVAWLPFLGWLVGDRTGYASTRVLPMGAYVEIGPAFGSRVRFSNATPWSADLPSDEAELIDLVHADLSASVRSVAQIPAPRRGADITGGRDSRLVLALMLQEGVADKFAFRTSGYEHSPDAVVGGQIATRFRLEHEAPVPHGLSEDDFRRRMGIHVFQTAGMFSLWEFKGALTISSTLRATGCVGEALRTHFHEYPAMATREELRRQFRGRSSLNGFSIVRPDVRSELIDVLDQELVECIDAGGSDPQDLADSFYWRNRNRRWFGTYEELGEAGRVHPLYSLVGLQAAFALGGQKRRLELLHFAIMRKACPVLAKMPLADSGWSEQLLAGLPDGDDYRVPPVRHKGRGPAPTQWRPQRLLDNLDVATDLLLDQGSSRLYDVIDRDAVQGVLADPARATPAVCRQLFGALAAAVWLGGTESRDRIGDKPKPAGHGQLSMPGAGPQRTPTRPRTRLRRPIRARIAPKLQRRIRTRIGR
jgi:hypothetical protein